MGALFSKSISGYPQRERDETMGYANVYIEAEAASMEISFASAFFMGFLLLSQ